MYDTGKTDQDEYDVLPRHQSPAQQDIYDVPPARQQYSAQVRRVPPRVYLPEGYTATKDSGALFPDMLVLVKFIFFLCLGVRHSSHGSKGAL